MSSDREKIRRIEKIDRDISEKIIEKIEEIDIELQENYTILSRKIRIYIFCLFLILSMVVDLESGIFNSSIDYLQEDLKMNSAEYGLFISITFTGRIIGLIIFMFLINFKHRKFILITTIFLHGSSYSLYQLTTNSIVLTFTKMFAACNKVCANIYRPVWIEQFGLSQYKSVFFSLAQVVSSYGQIIGFSLGSLLFKSNWKMALLSVLVLMYLITLGFLVVPRKYFFRSYMYYEGKLVDIDESYEENDIESLNNSSFELENKKGRKSHNNKKRKETIFVDSKKVKEKKNKKEKKSQKKTIHQNIILLLKDSLNLMKNKMFLFCMIKRANITFILQIIHSYLKQYQEHSLEDAKIDLIVLFYSISTLVSTAIGGLLGGFITKKLGGYESKKSIYIILISEVFLDIIISFLIFTKNFYIYNINLIFFFFFQSISGPIIQGYLIKTIPKSIKGIGVGVDMLVSTFLGKIPAPLIYGTIEDKYKEKNRDLAWKLCICHFYFGSIIILILCYLKKNENMIKDSGDVKIEDNIILLASISSGTDANDHFSMAIPVPKKRSKTLKTKLKISKENTDKKSMLSSILEESQIEEKEN